MASSSDSTSSLAALLEENVSVIGFFYKLTTALIVAALITHMAFASFYVYTVQGLNSEHVLLFAVFNAVALIVEIYLGRIGFMLGSRAGQLRDIQYALRIADSEVDVARFEMAAKAIMATRRDALGLKVLDIENIAARVAGDKTSNKSAA